MFCGSPRTALYTTPLNALIHSHKFDHHLYADNIQVYVPLSTDTYLYLRQLCDCHGEISAWMINNRLRLNTNKTDFIIIGTSRQGTKLTRFLPTPILNHSVTSSDIVRNVGVTFYSDFNFRKHISLTCRCCYLLYSWHSLYSSLYFSFSRHKPLLQHSLLVGLITSTLFFIASLCNGCHTVFQVFFPFWPTSEISALVPYSVSHHFQKQYRCLANFIYWRTLVSFFHAFSSTQAQKAPFIWFSFVA